MRDQRLKSHVGNSRRGNNENAFTFTYTGTFVFIQISMEMMHMMAMHDDVRSAYIFRCENDI